MRLKEQHSLKECMGRPGILRGAFPKKQLVYFFGYTKLGGGLWL